MTPQDTINPTNRTQTAQRRDAQASSSGGRDRPAGRRRIGLTTDSRGVSEVLGAILMFGLLISLLVLVQVNAVPAQNQQVEFEHNQRVEQDMLGLDRAVLQSGMLDVPGSSEIELAAHYPSRFFLINPSVGAGTVETMGDGTITIEGAHLSGASNYWNDDEGVDPDTEAATRTFETTSLRYRPNYKEYRNAPRTVYEHNVLANVYDTGTVPVDSGGFIDGNQITLVTVEGDLSRAGDGGFVVETTPVSAPAQTTTLENRDGEDVVITVSTTLSEETWTSLLADESAATITGFDEGDPYNELEVTLADGTYELRMARVAVGGSTGDSPLDPRYLVATDRPVDESIRVGETRELAVELRDRFNNPVEGRVRFEVTSGDGIFADDDGGDPDVTLVDTDETGTASAVFRGTDPEAVEVTATIVSQTDPEVDPDETPHEVTFEIDVTDPTDGGVIDDPISRINPTDSISLRYVSGNGKTQRFQLRNDEGGSVEVVEVRALFFISNDGSADNAFTIETEDDGVVDLAGTEDDKVSIAGEWYRIVSPTITVPNDDGLNTQLTFQFDDNPGQGTLGLAIRYEKDGVIFSENYFVFMG